MTATSYNSSSGRSAAANCRFILTHVVPQYLSFPQKLVGQTLHINIALKENGVVVEIIRFYV